MKQTEFLKKKEKTKQTGVGTDVKKETKRTPPLRIATQATARPSSAEENPSRRKRLLSSLHLRRTGRPLVRALLLGKLGHRRYKSGSVEHPLGAGVKRRPRARASNGPRAGAGAPKGADGDTGAGAARVASSRVSTLKF
jgi:hypothetical protein